jgi:hypothetical protein
MNPTSKQQVIDFIKKYTAEHGDTPGAVAIFEAGKASAEASAKPARDADHCDFPDCEQHNALQLARYKQALQRANGFLIMHGLEPVKLEYLSREEHHELCDTHDPIIRTKPCNCPPGWPITAEKSAEPREDAPGVMAAIERADAALAAAALALRAATTPSSPPAGDPNDAVVVSASAEPAGAGFTALANEFLSGDGKALGTWSESPIRKFAKWIDERSTEELLLTLWPEAKLHADPSRISAEEFRESEKP